MRTIVVIPAFNEGPRIAAVVTAVVRAGYRVLVVDDGSTDDTEYNARVAGARVLRLPRNQGKGRAMLAGVRASTEEVVMFLDGDMRGFSETHLRAIAGPVERGEWDQIVGVSEDATAFSRRVLLLSGQRAITREFLLKMPEKGWGGYGVEVWLNDTLDRFGGRSGVFTLHGVESTMQWEKKGDAMGLAAMADMGAEVFRAMQDIAQHYEKAPDAPTLTAKCSTTECVADALTESMAKNLAPLWTPEAQENVGEGVGRGIATPLWGILGVVSFLAAGWYGPVLTLMTYAASGSRSMLKRTL